MKKLITAILAVAICAAMSITAFAASPITGIGGTDSFDVKGKYNASARIDVYKVDISWGGMNFDYNTATEQWNATSHQWESTGTATWALKTGSSNTIALTNHSSTDVDITLAFAGNNGIDGAFKNDADNTAIANNSFNMAAANSTDGASAYTANFMPAGTLAATYLDYAKIGTITVTIN